MYAKNFLDQISEVKKKDTNTVISDATKGTVVGSTIGGGIGLLIGFSKDKNLLLCGFVGAVMGGLISRIFITKK
jgi:uncharacterized protein YcfJ